MLHGTVCKPNDAHYRALCYCLPPILCLKHLPIAEPPNPPRLIRVQEIGSTFARIEWEPSTMDTLDPISSYTVQFFKSDGKAFTHHTSDHFNSLSLSISAHLCHPFYWLQSCVSLARCRRVSGNWSTATNWLDILQYKSQENVEIQSIRVDIWKCK